MYNLVKSITYQNSLKTNRRLILIFQHHTVIDQYIIGRTYCSKKEDIIDKLDNLEQKIQTIVRKKTIDCLETKCKQNDSSLPDCSASDTSIDQGRRHPVHPIPKICCPPKPHERDSCIRPYVNPCPPHPLKSCDPCMRPVHPCRIECKKTKHETPTDKKIMQLDIRMMRILLALTTLLAGYVLYRIYGGQNHIPHVLIGEPVEKPRQPHKDPPYAVEIPGKAPYLIVGGGVAGHSAMRRLIELDPEAKILMVSKEHYYPYNRAPLNTELISTHYSIANELKYIPRGKNVTKYDKKSLFLENEDFYKPILEFEQNLDAPGYTVSIARGWEVLKLDCVNKIAHLDGKQIKYDKCIVATGSRPRHLAVFDENSQDVKERITYFTTIHDYKLLEEVVDKHKGDLTVAIVGGGLNGTELAISLRKKNIDVIQVLPERHNMAKLLPGYLADWLTKRVADLGVTLVKNSDVVDALVWEGGENDGRIALQLSNRITKKNSQIFADHVLLCSGNIPNTEIAEASAIEVDEVRGGFMVNSELQIRNDMFGAGDCISYFDSVYGRRHFEHHEHAQETGKVAAENLLGKGKTYDYQTLIWSDLLDDVGFESVGTINSKLPTVGIFYVGDKTEKIEEDPNNDADDIPKLEEFNKGIVFYLNHKNVIIGILTWNLYDRAVMLRKILDKRRTYEDCDALAKLMHIHH